MRFKAAVGDAYEAFLAEEESGVRGGSASIQSALTC
jgi:hypothetical protein